MKPIATANQKGGTGKTTIIGARKKLEPQIDDRKGQGA